MIDKDRVKRILIMKWSSMGDVVISTALIQDIVNAFPHARIDINTLPPWDRLFKKDPRFARILAIDLHASGRSVRGTLELLRAIKAGRYDMIVDLQSNDRSRILLTLLHLFFCRVPYRVGNHSGYPYNIFPRLPPASVIHAFRHQRLTIEAMGLTAATPRPVLHVETELRARAGTLMQAHGLERGRFAVFLPGCDANGWLKRWGTANYAGLARLLHDLKGYKVALIGAAAEQQECDTIAQLVGRPWLANLCGQTAMQEIVPLCEESAVIVANDTGTGHIASCAPTPMVVVCGPTDPRRVKPAGPNVLAIQAKKGCINCYCKKPCANHVCMQVLTPAIVFEHLELIMKNPLGVEPREDADLIIC
jgi:lipopolysaccharide heptosyltransferase II